MTKGQGIKLTDYPRLTNFAIHAL